MICISNICFFVASQINSPHWTRCMLFVFHLVRLYRCWWCFSSLIRCKCCLLCAPQSLQRWHWHFYSFPCVSTSFGHAPMGIEYHLDFVAVSQQLKCYLFHWVFRLCAFGCWPDIGFSWMVRVLCNQSMLIICRLAFLFSYSVPPAIQIDRHFNRITNISSVSLSTQNSILI